MISGYRTFIILFTFIFHSVYLLSAPTTSTWQHTPGTCRATLENDVLTLENDLISRQYRWNGGHLISTRLTDKLTGHTWMLDGKTPDCFLPGAAGEPTLGKLNVSEQKTTPITPAHLRAEVTVKLGGLEVKRIFRIYPDCPAIACDYYLRGQVNGNWTAATNNAGDLRNIENKATR
jgi:hypothetical protein